MSVVLLGLIQGVRGCPGMGWGGVGWKRWEGWDETGWDRMDRMA